MKYGLECEFFVAKTGVNPYAFIGGLDQSLTPDECGFLAEARGQPHDNIREAVFSLMADVYRLELAASKLDVELVQVPNAVVPYSEVLKSRRLHSKGLLQFQNYLGYESHKLRSKKTAGIHISVTSPIMYWGGDMEYGEENTTFKAKEKHYNSVWDFPQMFRYFDAAFQKEIKEAGRNPGFYEIKRDGRVEYRSLPNTVDLKKIIATVENFNV